MNLANKNVLVLGAGISGKGAIKLLLELKATVDVFEESNIILDKNVTKVDNLSKDYFMAVISPSFSKSHWLVKKLINNNVRLISELELGYIFSDNSTIAVTGTNGKTTTVSLLEYMLRLASLSVKTMGNIGVSYAGNILSLKESDIALLEVSSFQLEFTKYFSPEIAILLNITEDHINRHETFEEYKNIKLKIFKNQLSKDILIANYDDKIVRRAVKEARSKVYYYSLHKKVMGVYVKDNCIFYADPLNTIYIMDIDDLYSSYPHNVSNCLACIALGIKLNIPVTVIKKAVSNFKPLSHRMQKVRIFNDITFINDSKATNIKSTLCAVESLKENLGLIVGGSDKGENFDNLFSKISSNVKIVCVLGENKKAILKSCKKNNIEAKNFDNLECAVNYLSKLDNITTVLFSPASASFDRYRDYIERGNDFCKIVKQL